jgi:hypothetical protein
LTGPRWEDDNDDEAASYMTEEELNNADAEGGSDADPGL